MNEGDFNKLYEATFPILFRVAVRITGQEEEAEDVVLEAFSKIHERGMVFPSLDDGKFWLLRVVKNAALNTAKRKARERRAYEKAFRETRQSWEDASKPLEREETRREVVQSLDALPDTLKWPLIFKEYAGLDYKEIGRVLGISESNVKVRIFRARERLVNALEGPKADNVKDKKK
jgi:RNA polymerase sigma-70 factor (ECF subfamily)